MLPPGHPSNHPHILLFSGDVSLTPQPTSRRSFSPRHGHLLRWLHRLRVVLFLGLALVHRVCALGAARSTWSTNNSHRKRLIVGAHTGKYLLIPRKIMMLDCGFRQTLEVQTLGCARRALPHQLVSCRLAKDLGYTMNNTRGARFILVQATVVV